MPAGDAILQLSDMSFAYEGQPILWDRRSFSISAGITQISGDTGSGKSTLLRVLGGVLAADGRITLDRRTLERTSSHTERDAYRRKVLFIDTATEAFDAMTARECVGSLVGGNVPFDEAQWQKLVEGFGLTPHLGKPIYMLSTGSKRKVWLSAALASRHPLTLLDEPTAGLDAASIAFLFRALEETAATIDRAIVIASAERFDRLSLAASIDLPLV